MLITLRIKNLAIVDNIRVEFGKGLNIITGETGAGKSILAQALGLVLGERADRTIIRSGEDPCGVEAHFQLADAVPVDAILSELGLEPCEDGRLILRRIVSAAGGGKNLVNDSPVTVQALKRIGDCLVDLHGPHDHQSLLRQDFQRDLLDAYGHLAAAREAYAAVYREREELKARRRELEGDENEVARQIDLMAFQVKEIEDARLTEADEGDLESEHAVVANAQRILELAGGLRNALTESDTSAFASLTSLQNALNELAALLPEAGEWKKEAEAIAVQVQELSSSVSDRVSRIEGDPERLQWLEDRKSLLHKLKRKYGATVSDILAFLKTAKARLEDLQTRGEKIAQIDARLAEVTKALESAGLALRKERQKAGDAMAGEITRELKDLGFKQGVFRCDLLPSEPGPAGMEEVDFGFAPNVGEAMRPLRAIASSGEISRVMLATKAVLAGHDRIPVLVFDEIDANVGGEMGNAIGEKLATVAGGHQVVCITHLPQVAVHGMTHFVVEKSVKSGRTFTAIRPVEGEARVEEVARMLGGRDLTSVTLKHAREMLK